jgi:hypothetical protein
LAASCRWSTISLTIASTFASTSDRVSASTRQRSGTTLVDALPPSTRPTLTVVSSSIRPSRIATTPRAAAAIALRPSSGRIPAWAAVPWKSASMR